MANSPARHSLAFQFSPFARTRLQAMGTRDDATKRAIARPDPSWSRRQKRAGNMPGLGARYPSTFKDADGDYLMGDKSYRLHLPPDVPAALFWSITAYSPVDGRMIDAGQPFPSINSMISGRRLRRASRRRTGSRLIPVKATCCRCASMARRTHSTTRAGYPTTSQKCSEN